MSTATLPVVDLDVFFADPTSPTALAECNKAANALITYGALIVHDSRVSEDDNTRFLDLVEDYFAQPESALRADERPEVAYLVGVTLENTEKPKCAVDEPCLRVIERLAPSERPLDISGHHPDPKSRFFWRMGERPPYDMEFSTFDVQNVLPADPAIRTRWEPTLESWGHSMKTAVESLSEMAAVGLGLPRDTFREAGRYGPHVLAPTASDLTKYGKKDTILAGFHADLNFLTIHGRSRYPGLNIWARNSGKRIAVRFPAPGEAGAGRHLLVQAGKQLEHLTGGLVKAGFHEVVVNEATIAAIEERRRTAPDRPLIRISSTFFWHLSSDYILAPIESLAAQAHAPHAERPNLGEEEDEVTYEPIKVGAQVLKELQHIALMA